VERANKEQRNMEHKQRQNDLEKGIQIENEIKRQRREALKNDMVGSIEYHDSLKQK
jgi:hypothetical protein